ncbi:extracellular solute-binding protein [Actinocatenispora rupis]|uniref:Sugar ABC transporter substrate-binding protein n=1 Tax=Actinocatenispora rupis TaxID=519421 RepID=A0A8J3IV89_9ACTN|nr:extracellular solute-binding protein [Actinocatenispora rupis]GID10571.1 sugar ABC transporter substrate-binding protein [Actinocatenispora rupis]
MPENASGLSRRTVLRAGTGVAVAGTIGAGVLSTVAGCGTDSGAGKVSSAADVTLPKTIPYDGPTPDVPGTPEGVPAGFYAYPKPVKAFASPPLSNERITAITNVIGAPPPDRSANPAWQAVEKRLGASVDITSVSSADYETKLNTVIAGGKLPDIMLYDGGGMSDLPAFLAAKCADLTPLLRGDKVKDFPHLAAIPQLVWQTCTQAGKLYLLPIPRNLVGGSGFYNSTLFGQAGVKSTQDIRNADDFLGVLKELTRPKQNRWALGSTNFGTVPFHHIFGSPLNWRLDGGKLVRSYETPEYQAALEFLVKVHKAGCFVPGSEAWTKQQMMDAFHTGKVSMVYDGLPAFAGPTGYYAALPATHKGFQARPFLPFGHDGGKPVTWFDNKAFGWVMLAKADEKRLRTVLKACDFFAAPFGTEEYLLLNYGVEGTDYHLDPHGNPVLTAKGNQDTLVPWKYLSAPTQVVYDPTSKEYVDILHDAYAKLIPTAVADPTETLYSPTNGRKGVALGQFMSDTITSVIAGRKPFSAFTDAVKQWRSKGGDTIRGEYQEALSKQKKH